MAVKFDKLVFNSKDKIGKGSFGEVYRVTDGTKYDHRYVVKLMFSPKMLSFINKLAFGSTFEKEVEALEYLGTLNISPKLVYVHNRFTSRYYIMESMDTTLFNILEEDYFTREHLEKLTALLERLVKSKYRHSDLHTNNIMWSNKLTDFRIIDWGMYKTLNNATGEINNSVRRMMLSGDMYVIVQLYVAYRLKQGDTNEYWGKAFNDFLKYVPKNEHVFEKYSANVLNNKVIYGIEQDIKTKKSNNRKRTKLISTHKTKPNNLTKREAQKLLGEKTNTGFYEFISK